MVSSSGKSATWTATCARSGASATKNGGHQLRAIVLDRPSRGRRPHPCRKLERAISAAPARRCSTGCSPATTAADLRCASRTPTANARPRRRSTRSSTACLAGARLGRRRRLSVRARRAPRRRGPAAAGARARPTAATARRKSWRRCARRPAPRAARRSTTAAGATATRPRRPRRRPGGPHQDAARTARP